MFAIGEENTIANKLKTANKAIKADKFTRKTKTKNRVISPMKLNSEFKPANMANATAKAIWLGAASEFNTFNNFASKVSTSTPC